MPEGSVTGGGTAPWALDLRGTTAPVLVEVRRWASRTLAQVDDAHLGDVLLVATELVTNAYDHGQGPLQIRMSHTAEPCRVRLEVDDSSPDLPVVAAPSRERLGGRGLQIVDKLADTWGVLAHPAGSKTVWAEVSCAGLDASPCAAPSSEPVEEPAVPQPERALDAGQHRAGGE
ncbi:ATP-binding protein [Amycolatopsis sp. NPDC049159]|uniref:ATP-binding protein n=1 Tax=Amycolatopsis sp. NPDC049159 TaxID=3157210 RepID=UPI0033D3564E